MLKLVVFFVAVFVSSTTARQFNNPVLGGADYPDPGVLKVGDYYYAVTTTNNDRFDKFPIHVSNDLQNWNFIGYVLTEANFPKWVKGVNFEFWAPELHQVGEKEFRVYFTSRNAENDMWAIGVASSNNVQGPYIPADRPLMVDPTQSILDATISDFDGQRYLIWKGREWVYGRAMSSDGLSFTEDTIVQIIRNDLPWEDLIIEGPWVVYRNGFYFMFYSGNGFCGDRYAVGVARAPHPLGPYEKRGDPILVSNNNFKGPGHCSVVKDVDNVGDVMVYHAYRAGEVCDPFPRLMMAQSVGWGADNWPYMM